MEAINIRSHTDNDIPFIQNSWLTSYRESSQFAKEIPRQIFFKFHHSIIENILSRKTTTVLIATTENDEELILGYLVVEKVMDYGIVHYTYIKRPMNGFGLSKLLFTKCPFEITNKTYASHMTYKGRKIIEKYGLQYCPYLL